MRKGIFITGTDTDVGKTWVGQQLISNLIKRNIEVIPRKPIESGWSDNIKDTDAWHLARAAGITEKINQVCPTHFKAAISPARAARLEKQTISLDELKQSCFSYIQKDQFLHVEGAGGFYSPLAKNILNADLAKALGLPVLLVAEDRVGCINQILLTIEAAKIRKVPILSIFLNKIDKTGNSSTILMDNAEDLREFTSIPIVTDVNSLAELAINSTPTTWQITN